MWASALPRTLRATVGSPAVWLLAGVLSDSLLDEGGWLLADTLLLGAMMALSGILPIKERRGNPVSEDESSEWTGSKPLHSIASAAAFLTGVRSLPGWRSS